MFAKTHVNVQPSLSNKMLLWCNREKTCLILFPLWCKPLLKIVHVQIWERLLSICFENLTYNIDIGLYIVLSVSLCASVCLSLCLSAFVSVSFSLSVSVLLCLCLPLSLSLSQRIVGKEFEDVKTALLKMYKIIISCWTKCMIA